jgi:hypothetical protein
VNGFSTEQVRSHSFGIETGRSGSVSTLQIEENQRRRKGVREEKGSGVILLVSEKKGVRRAL